MADCQDCRQPVRFLLLGTKEDGSNKWSQPLDLADRIVMERASQGAQPFVHQGYVQTETFTLHNCPERQAAQAGRLRVRQEREARARTTSEAWEEALKHNCSKCGRRANERCINLSDVRRGYASPHETRHPHAERLPPGWYSQHQAVADG